MSTVVLHAGIVGVEVSGISMIRIGLQELLFCIMRMAKSGISWLRLILRSVIP